jgi:hypothetical protein
MLQAASAPLMRGRGLLGLASRVAGAKGFSTEIFVSSKSISLTEYITTVAFSW